MLIKTAYFNTSEKSTQRELSTFFSCLFHSSHSSDCTSHRWDWVEWKRSTCWQKHSKIRFHSPQTYDVQYTVNKTRRKKTTVRTFAFTTRSYERSYGERNFYDHTINIYWRRLFEAARCFVLENSADEAIPLCLCRWYMFEWLGMALYLRFMFDDVMWIFPVRNQIGHTSLFKIIGHTSLTTDSKS